MQVPKTRYAKSGDINIAYQVFGEGEHTLVFAPAWVSHVDMGWEEPGHARFLNDLGRFARIILFDKRGTGASDRNVGTPTLEDRMDDIRAVMDAAGTERAALFGCCDGASMSAMFAAAHPQRTSHLMLFAPFAARLASPDYPWGQSAEERLRYIASIEENWGSGAEIASMAPSRRSDAAFLEWCARLERFGGSPGAAMALARMNSQTDIRCLLPHIESALVTIVCTDIVGSTERAADLGDRRWNSLIERHDDIVAAELRRFQGAKINTTGDGVLAAFDSPGRGIRAAMAIKEALSPLDLAIRAGVHTGECELRQGVPSGIALNIGARVAGLANAGEILASRTVKDLMVGAELSFLDRGEHRLKGVPGEWRIYAVSP